MKLSLRELFLLVTLAAMGCGWWLDHHGWAARERLALDTLYKASNANPDSGLFEPIFEGKVPLPGNDGKSEAEELAVEQEEFYPQRRLEQDSKEE
jgi:hypothetical protein